MLSVNRLDRYKRIDLLIEAAKADPALRIVIVGDGPDRGRLEGLASGLNGQVEFTGRVDGERLADLYARCLAVYYAPVDEDYGMVPYEAFLSAKPVVTTVDAGGPLEVVHDGETGVVVEPDPAAIARPAPYLAAHRRRGEARSARRARRSPSGSPGTPASTPARREGRLLLAAAAVALGDRRLLDAAPAGAARADRGGRRRASRGKRAPPADVDLYHVGNDPDAHGWIVDALRKRPGVVVLHELVLHHLIAGITIGRGDGARLPRRDGARLRRRRAPDRRSASLDNLLPLIWETQPERFPLTGTVLDLADGPDRPLALRRGAARARPATPGRSGGSRTRPGRTTGVAPGRASAATR